MEINSDALYQEQLDEWSEFRERVEQLNTIQTRKIEMGGYHIIAQFNPARAVSSGAKLDKKSIAARKCFLCSNNRSTIQKGIELNERFTLLVNPFPILKKHFTIPLNEHCAQEILPYMADFLNFAQRMPRYILFYNGPQCGASAPDHIHFQAIEKGQLPLEKEWQLQEKEIWKENDDSKVEQLLNYGRKCVHIQSACADTVIREFKSLYNKFQKETNTNEEPKMNLFGFIENGLIHLFIFHRRTHRPAQFFETGEKFKMISPGAIDIAGIFVLPRREDYKSICKEEILDVLEQVSY